MAAALICASSISVSLINFLLIVVKFSMTSGSLYVQCLHAPFLATWLHVHSFRSHSILYRCTDNFKPAALITANKVFIVGLPFVDNAR